MLTAEEEQILMKVQGRMAAAIDAQVNGLRSGNMDISTRPGPDTLRPERSERRFQERSW